jgi:hypothetical protein
LKEEVSALEGATDKKSISRREMLYQKIRKLFNNALRDWQKRQTNKYSDRTLIPQDDLRSGQVPDA